MSALSLEELWQRLDALSVDKRNLLLRRLRAEGWPVSMHPERRASSLVTLPNLAAEAYLDPSIVPAEAGYWPDRPRALLLTGATGFLGAFLLRELVTRTEATIYALVRAPSAESGLERILANLRQYELPTNDLSQRIIAVPGDVSKLRMGLSRTAFDELAGKVDAVYHSAAFLNFLFGYEAFIGPNVVGTQEALRLACAGRPKAFHFISTLKFFMMSLAEDRAPIAEQKSLERGSYCGGGYAQSKWVAEKLVTIAQGRGLATSVHRCGLVWGDSKTGACLESEVFCRTLESAVQLGFLPGEHIPMYAAPVDFAARAVVATSLRRESLNQTFHVASPEPAALFPITAMRRAGYAIEPLTTSEWVSRITRLSDGGGRNALSQLMPFITAQWPGNLQTLEVLAKVPRIEVQAAQTIDDSLVCPPLDDVVTVCMDRMIRRGIIGPRGAPR